MASAGSLRGRALQGDDNEKRPETNEDDDTATAENAPNDGNDGNAPNDGNDPNGGNAGNGAAAEEEEENDDAGTSDRSGGGRGLASSSFCSRTTRASLSLA